MMLPFILRLLATLPLLVGSQEAVLLFAGDAMQHQAQLDVAYTSHGYDYSDCFTEINQFVSEADYAVVNLETTLGDRNFTGYPCFCSPDSYAEALADAGFDLFLTANNHTLDRHDRGHERTIHVLDSLRLDHIGTYLDKQSRAHVIPFIKNVNGFRIGFLNYTYGTNGISLSGKGVVDYIDRDLIANDIKAAKAAGAEVIVAAIHWGVEYQLLPHSSQKSLADFLVENGVDLVIGGHPHVIQPMEIRRSESTGKESLVVYSLGNFISNMRTTDTRGGAILRVTLARDSIGNPQIRRAAYSLVFTVPPSIGKRNFTLHPVESGEIPSAWTARKEAFVNSAERIFRRHNRGVERESILPEHNF